MKFIIGYLVKKLGREAVLIGISVLRIAFIIAFFAFITISLHTLKNFIQSFFDVYTTSSSSDGLISNFYGYMSVLGINDALTTSMPLIVSAISFLLTKILWKYSDQAYRDIVKNVNYVMGGM